MTHESAGTPDSIIVQTVPDLIGVGVNALVENASRLGITWTLRIATVSTVGIESVDAVYDGDTSAIGMVNMLGTGLAIGQRVYVMMIPPSGNFIVGFATQPLLGNNCTMVSSMASGTSTSAAYVAQPGSPSVVLTKRFDATSLRFSWDQTYFLSGADASVQFAAISSGGDQAFLGKVSVSSAALNAHTAVSGTVGYSGIPAGRQTWVGSWLRAAGAGTMSVDSGDFWTMCIEEYWPSD